MRFGTFVFSISFDPKDDYRVIEESLREVELAEETGLDAVWLPEHNFDGAVAYADPVVFAGAVAMRTRKVRIGFAVVEMALHHPVRLAVQTSLLDNLSQGRLIVGTGRGSALNEYEYMGFGTTSDAGREMMAEAEELLVKAWTCEDLRHEGRFWQVSLPILRPRPFQKPHPLLVRACLSEASTVEMAKVGRPVLLAYMHLDTLQQRLQLYRDTLQSSGLDDAAIGKALDETWATQALYVADSDEEATEAAAIGMERYHEHIQGARRKYNPGGVISPQSGQPTPTRPAMQEAFLAGTPRTVAEKIGELRDAGVRNLLLNVNVGQMPQENVEKSLRLFGEKVLPKFKSH